MKLSPSAILAPFPGAMYHAAGPPAFVQRVRGAVASLGVPGERLRLEVFKNYDEP